MIVDFFYILFKLLFKMKVIIRITDFYAKILIKNNRNTDILHQYLLSLNIKDDKIEYLKSLKYEYYDMVDDKPFNCMLYDKDKINSFKLLSYDEIYYNTIKTLFNNYSEQLAECGTIMIAYDDSVIKIFGEELYFNTFDKIKTEFNLTFEFKHVKNIIPGEVLSIELGFCRDVYILKSYNHKYLPHWIDQKNECPDLIGQTNEFLRGYIVRKDLYQKRRMIDKFFMLVDFHAFDSTCYVYKLSENNITLYKTETIPCGFMTIVNWLSEKSKYKQDVYIKFKNFISQISYFNYSCRNVIFNGVEIDNKIYFDESPIKNVINVLINIQHQILHEYRFEKEVYISYCIENIIEMNLINIELKNETFNGNSNRMLLEYDFLEKVRNKTLNYCGDYTSIDLIDRKTKSNHFLIKIPFHELGYHYSFEDIE